MKWMILLSLVLLLAACQAGTGSKSDTGGDEDTDADTDLDVDTDSDTNSDTNSDTDTDTDGTDISIHEPPDGCLLVSNYTTPGEGDNTTELVQAFSDLDNGECLFFDLRGTYRVAIGTSLSVEGMTDVSVYGNGSRIEVFGYDASQEISQDAVFSVESTLRTSLMDFIVALDRPHYIFGTVVDAGASNNDGDFDVLVDPGYPVTPSQSDAGALYVEHIMHWVNDELPGDWEVFSGGTRVRCEGSCESADTLHVTTSSGREPPESEKVLIMHHKRQLHGIDVTDSQNAQILGVTFENLAGSGIFGNRITDFHVDGLRSRKPAMGHSSVNDLLWIRGARGDITVSNVSANFQTDDAFNIHPPLTAITYVSSGVCNHADGARIQWFAEAGDPVQLYDGQLQPIGTATYQGVNGDQYTLDGAGPNARFAVPTQWSPNSVHLSNYHVATGRSRIVIKTPNTTIERCSSRHNMMAGIIMVHEAYWASEAGWIDNILVDDCTFDDVSRNVNGHVAAVLISASDSNNDLLTVPSQGSVVIRNSHFENLPQAAIVGHATRSLTLENNTFGGIAKTPSPSNKFNNDFGGFEAGAHTVSVIATDAAALSGNTEDGEPVSLACGPHAEALCQ